MPSKIILASQSPRRKELLQQADLNFEVVVQPTDESYPNNLSNEQVAIHIARNKAKAVAALHTDAVIIAADTIVLLHNEIIGKPINVEDALHILAKLSGQTHQVVTGVVMVINGKYFEFADTTSVVFNTLTTEQIQYYVDKYKPLDKAGAYGIQDWIGAVGIQKIEGDFYNVMGLPINRVVALLQNEGVL
jgi:septum formation protein